MRPIRRGGAPKGSYTDYRKAIADLVSRLGPYCSYCERLVTSTIAVEHIQPKALHPHLENIWSNFLLACVNCNSTKKDKDVQFSQVLLPDRDNTFIAFSYQADGSIDVSTYTSANSLQTIAAETLRLTGLDLAAQNTPDINGRQVALDRVRQRQEAWNEADIAKTNLQNNPNNAILREYIVKLAKKTGFFSVWMTVFANDSDMRQRLINAFPGTTDSACFDQRGNPVSPAPNPDALADGGKI